MRLSRHLNERKQVRSVLFLDLFNGLRTVKLEKNSHSEILLSIPIPYCKTHVWKFRLSVRIAGANGNAVSLTFTLYYILSVPRVWERLSREIQTRFQTIEEITGQSTAQLQYLDAVINEGIALHST